MLFDLINRNMRIKNIRIGLLHNMEHYEFAGHVLTMARGTNIKKINPLLSELERVRVRRARVDHSGGGEYQDARENTPRGGRWK